MRRTPVTIAACAAAFCALAAPASAVTVQELGDFSQPAMPAADCPGRVNTTDCQAIAQVSGFQVQLGSHSTPFRIRAPGWVLAFTLRLAKPTTDQINFFKTTYGPKATARLAVIRNVSQSKKTYRLLKLSQAFDMEPYFGSTQTFALHTPFRVHKDDIVALTVPTWLPAFSHNLPSDNAWRSSHSGSECTASAPPTAAHEKVGTTKVYGCFYRGARLLYSATFVPDPKITNTASAR